MQFCEAPLQQNQKGGSGDRVPSNHVFVIQHMGLEKNNQTNPTWNVRWIKAEKKTKG